MSRTSVRQAWRTGWSLRWWRDGGGPSVRYRGDGPGVFAALAYRDRFERVAIVSFWVAVAFGIAGLVQLTGCGDAVSTSTEKGVCDSSYEGACLDAESSDYDCEGGSGDGPDYTGPVAVVGDDHFELDRDGDGYACE